MRVLIIGGGRLGQSIADRLLAKDEHRMVFRSHEHQITFIEKDETVCSTLEALRRPDLPRGRHQEEDPRAGLFQERRRQL